jgi:translation initiation factor 2 alpha subunit (eIF-2alpha)
VALGDRRVTGFGLAVITTSTPEKVDGLKALENAIERIETTIKKLDGHFAIQMAVSWIEWWLI